MPFEACKAWLLNFRCFCGCLRCALLGLVKIIWKYSRAATAADMSQPTLWRSFWWNNYDMNVIGGCYHRKIWYGSNKRVTNFDELTGLACFFLPRISSVQELAWPAVVQWWFTFFTGFFTVFEKYCYEQIFKEFFYSELSVSFLCPSLPPSPLPSISMLVT